MKGILWLFMTRTTEIFIRCYNQFMVKKCRGFPSFRCMAFTTFGSKLSMQTVRRIIMATAAVIYRFRIQQFMFETFV
jgi:hypothetical protein